MKRLFLLAGILSLSNGAWAKHSVESLSQNILCGQHASSRTLAVSSLGQSIERAFDLSWEILTDDERELVLVFKDDDGDVVKVSKPTVREQWDGWQGQDLYQACLKVR